MRVEDTTSAAIQAFLYQTATSLSAKTYLHSTAADGHVFVSSDAPGMGKTSTVFESATQEKCRYVCVHGGNGVMRRTCDFLSAKLKTLAKASDGFVSFEDSAKLGVKAWKAAFVKLLQLSVNSFANGSPIGLLLGNGAVWSLVDRTAGTAEKEAVVLEC